MDNIEELVFSNEQINEDTLPETSGRVIPLFKGEASPRLWYKFVSNPALVFQQAMLLSGYRTPATSQILNKLTLSAEDTKKSVLGL